MQLCIRWMTHTIICSNFGSIQPESKVAVWSTSAKPAMSGSQACDGISQDSWGVAGHVGIEHEVAMMSPTEQLMSIPAQFKDIATGELIPNDRCLYNCKELDRIQNYSKKAGTSTRLSREIHLVLKMKRRLLQRMLLKNMLVVAILRYGTGYAGIRFASHCLQQDPLLQTLKRQRTMSRGYSWHYINVTQA